MAEARSSAVPPQPDRSGPRPGRRRSRSHLGVHAVLIPASLVMVAPFVWQLITSLKTLSSATRVPPSLLPEGRWENYRQVFQLLPFGDQFLNTTLMAAGRTAGQVLLCPLAAYAFARLRFPGREVLFGLFLSVLMVPPQLFIIPQYQIMASLGWLNTLQALIVPGMFSAFGVFLLRQFFLGLPPELEEAARLDGAGPLRIYWFIMLPLARPGVIALSVLALLWSWNDLFWPLVVNTDPEQMTLSAGLSALQGQFQTDYPVLMAGSLLASLPVIAAFALLQRQFIQGIAHTGVKG
ncbi:carbohydrate ABC transporter permease [Streptomyces paludis]|uniref:Carbohydrate ABC transporter permease n=1 Tax=Streptomyces paludis TaxID=2282738 RepID=A0A345HJS8_9ACTN|nr:carbohydrate ABC transporter permease [Streptomyces paludis]AXG76952.1 carbohydrate ABC transporter permease [Streptomyces paludis]